MRYYYSYLDYKQPLLHQLLPVIAKQFEHVFPEVTNQKDFIHKVIHEEENNFLRTLDKGLKRIEDILSVSKKSEASIIQGADAFELYDTYGFPVDLTLLIAKENNLKVDEEGFEREMLQQKNRSRAASVVDNEDWIMVGENLPSKFVG